MKEDLKCTHSSEEGASDIYRAVEEPLFQRSERPGIQPNVALNLVLVSSCEV